MILHTIAADHVADPGCLSRKPDPDFYPSRIPDLGSRIITLCSHKFHKIAHYFSFDVLKKKIWDNFQRNIELFTQKIVNKLSKIWIWDPGSGKNLFRIPDPGVKKAPDPGSRIPDPQHWLQTRIRIISRETESQAKASRSVSTTQQHCHSKLKFAQND